MHFPPPNVTGSFKLQLSANSVFSDGSPDLNAPTSNIISSSIAIDSTDIYRIATAEFRDTFFFAGKLQTTLTFDVANISGLSSTDFEILDSDGSIQSGWSFDPIPQTVNSGVSVPISVAAPLNANGSFKIRLLSNSVMSDGSPSNNAPGSPIETNLVNINNVIQPTFPFLREVTTTTPPISDIASEIYLAATDEYIYLFDNNRIVVYEGFGINTIGSPIELGNANYTGFEVVGNNFYAIVSDQRLNISTRLQSNANLSVSGRFTPVAPGGGPLSLANPLYFPLEYFQYGEFESFNSDGIRVSSFELKQDDHSMPLTNSNSTTLG